MKLQIAEIANLRDALDVAAIRNDCREWLTNDTSTIHPLRQARWFRRTYCKQDPKNYMVWLARDADQHPVGYVAIALKGDGAHLTVCVAAKARRSGVGAEMLDFLKQQKWRSEIPRILVATIRPDNERSINLHRKLGFEDRGIEPSGLARFDLKIP